jgi:protein gp37
MTDAGPRWTGKVVCRDDQLTWPLRKSRPRVIFVGDRGDLFHDAVPDEYIARVWAKMVEARQHTFLVLTKRAERMHELLTRVETGRVTKWGHHAGTCLPDYPWFKCRVWQLSWMQGSGGQPPTDVFRDGWDKHWPPKNIWLGVSAEDQKRWDERVPLLMATPCAGHFVSCEPLLGPIEMICPGCNGNVNDHHAPDQGGCSGNFPQGIIVGGESGHGARACSTCEFNPLVPSQDDHAGAWCCVPIYCRKESLGKMRCYGSHGWRPRLVHPRPTLSGYTEVRIAPGRQTIIDELAEGRG